MATEPLTGARIPDLSYSPNIPQDISNGVRDLASNTSPHFTSTGARDSAFSAWVSAGGAMRDGLFCTVGTKEYMYSSSASAWVEMGDAGAWSTYSVTISAAGGSFGLGNGSVTGRYRKIGQSCTVQILFVCGSTTSGAVGGLSFNLPFTAAAFEQNLLAKAYTTGGGNRNWSGFGYVAASSSSVLPHFSNNASPPYWEQARTADASQAAGTSIPFVSGQYAYGTSSVIAVQGTYETAS